MQTDALTNKELSFDKTQALLERRKAIVPHGVGIFAPTTVVKAEGGVIQDVDGNELIDFGGGIGVLNAGHCPEPVVAAIKHQAEQFLHTCFHVSTYEPYVELCEQLAALFPHGDNTKVMLTNTGAESVENAIKIARQATKRSAVICYTEAFHGRSMMAMTLTSKINYKTDCGPFAPEVYRLPFPNYYMDGDGMTEEEFVAQELHRLEESAYVMINPKEVAAIIVEPVQGEGGFNVVPKAYMKGLRAFCDKHGIVMILDEVQSGFCRTAKWAAFHHYDVTPDLSTWAKSMGSGMPIGAVIGKQEIMDKAASGTIGGTYLGNPVSCAAALATIQYMKDVDMNSKAAHISEIVANRFAQMKERTNVIGDIRGLGAMQAVELIKNNDKHQPDSELVSQLIAACLQRGLILLNAGVHKNILRILSPLMISDELLNKGLDIIEEELYKMTNTK